MFAIQLTYVGQNVTRYITAGNVSPAQVKPYYSRDEAEQAAEEMRARPANSHLVFEVVDFPN